MASQVTTLNVDGLLPVPAEAQEWLGIRPGSRVQFIREDGRVVLSPAPEDDPLQMLRALPEGSGLEDDLIQMRREEEEHLQRKLGW